MAAKLLDGPGTTSSRTPDNFTPSTLQIAPSAEHLVVVALSARVTSASEDGVTVISHRALLPGTSRRTLSTEPPVTVKAWSRTVAKPTAGASLNHSSKLNAALPSWDAGASCVVAVSG